jgi:hypothetical protein
MKNVMKYAALFALSAAVVMACSAEVYAAHAGQESAAVVPLASQPPAGFFADAPLPAQLARGLVVTEAALPGKA